MLIDGLVRMARQRLTAGGRPLRFLVAGGVNTLFGLSVYPILLWSFASLHRHYMVGLVIAQALSLCFAFAVYKLTVFRTRQGTIGEIARFLPFYLVNYAMNWVALPLLVTGARIDPIVAQLAFTMLLIIGSYFWHSRVTFRATRDRP